MLYSFLKDCYFLVSIPEKYVLTSDNHLFLRKLGSELLIAYF